MSDCHQHCTANVTNPSVHQSLDELEFERGIWFAAQHGDLDRVKKLLSQRNCANQLDAAGYTALHYAARSGHVAVCKYLINAGALVDATTRAGHATPLHRAVSAGKEYVVAMLLEAGADVALVDADGKNALHRGVESGCSNVVKMLLNLNLSLHLKQAQDHKGNVPQDYVGNNLHLAALLDNTCNK